MIIKHMAMSTIQFGNPEGEAYLCNPAPLDNADNLVYDWTFVTCKKCLKLKEKR
jgi:hypothetical protein